MPSRDEVEQLRSANAELSSLVDAELGDFFASVGDSEPEVVRDALLDFVPTLVTEYGDVAATASAEWFEQVYGGRVNLAPATSREVVEQGVKYVAGQLWTPTPLEAFSALSVKLDKWIKQPGRDTMAMSAESAGMRWARVPSGGKTCAWCLVLASRDAVYLTEKSASKAADGSSFHGKCRCQPVPMNSWDDYPDGYNPQALYDVYTESARSAGTSSDINAIAADIRRRRPELLTDGIVPAA